MKKKMIFILVDGMSFEIMKYPSMVDLAFLKNTQSKHFYPECLNYYDEWKKFEYNSFLDPSISRNENISSADLAAMISTGLTKSFMDFNSHTINLNDISLFSELKNNDVKVAALTNMPITDSTLGMLIAPDEINMYTKKSDVKKISYTNLDMQNNIAAKLEGCPWDLLAGGGRMCFYPKTSEDIVTKGEYGKRDDDRNVLKELQESEKIKCIFEDSIDNINLDLNSNIRYLMLLHHNDFMFEVERQCVKSIEPRLSDIGMRIVRSLDESDKDWFFFVESGKVDQAAHNNNGYFVLGEILEVYRFLYLLSLEPNYDEYTIVFTSDHETGGLSFADNYNLPYDAFRDGAYWSDGPGKNRFDTTIFMENGQLKEIHDFTKEFESKPNFRSQLSASNTKIAMHSRSIVPLLVKGNESNNFNGCKYHIDLYYSVLNSFGINKNTEYCDTEIIVVTGPPAAGKSTLSRKLAEKLGYKYLKGDDYFNAIDSIEGDYGDERLDITIENIFFDADSLLRHNICVIVDFVFLRPQEIILLKKFKKSHRLHFVVLNVDEETVIYRDSMRDEEEQMGNRCVILSRKFNESIKEFAELSPIMADYKKSPDKLAESIIDIIRGR